MKKIIILFLVIFISLIYTVNSLKMFDINETDKLSLGLRAEDPDADKLIYTFSDPLNKNGEWQTDYGDAGEYKTSVSVSDGVTKVSEEVLITVHKKEEKPVIDRFAPKEDSLAIDEGKSIKFSADASDVNNDKLNYKWLVNGNIVSENNEMAFEAGYSGAGDYIVEFTASDGTFSASKQWNVKVNNVDIEGILSSIKDITILETEKASIQLPDFKKYGLSYEISEPLGNKNMWQTGYNDAGDYTVKVKVKGNGFEGEKDVKVAVKNKDRPPQLIGLNDATINENEQVKIELEAIDPDDDNIKLSAENMPQDATLEGNEFIWTPNYDFVQKANSFDYMLDKFRILSRSADITFKAESNGLIAEKKVKISVKDVNRPFIIENIPDIEVNEGDDLVIEPKYNSPDKNKVSFSYSGFMDSNKKSTNFGDAGLYIVKVAATDGYFTETRFVNVKVNHVNRKPILDKVSNVEVNEGHEARIELNAVDMDNDAVVFSAKNIPNGAVLKDNLFIWKPGFGMVNGTKKEFTINFIASDGIGEDEQKSKIIVINVNQAPKIINYSNSLIAVKGKPVIFEIGVIDADGDNLTYEWSFGFFDKYKGSNTHQRVFTTTGNKKVEVTVSDGKEKVSKVWNVKVV